VLPTARTSHLSPLTSPAPVQPTGGKRLKTRPDRTVLAIAADIPGLDESKASHLSAMMQRSVENVKRLAESDL
jgi:hypothetical protein